MKKMIIFDPAMCCSTGVCGPSVDKELLRVATLLSNLRRKGIEVERHNLTNNPQKFVDTKIISTMLLNEGIEVLPITMVDNEVVKTKAYPTNEEFLCLLDLPADFLKVTIKMPAAGKVKSCDCEDGCC